MELIKVKPSSIEKTSKCPSCHGKRVKHYCIPKKVNTTITEAKKHHYIIQDNGTQYYSYELNAMLQSLTLIYQTSLI